MYLVRRAAGRWAELISDWLAEKYAGWDRCKDWGQMVCRC